MRSTLPIWGRLASACRLSTFFLFLFFGVTSADAKTIVIGSGGGIVAYSGTNNGTVQPGDVIAIQPGNYLGGSFGDLKGVTITSNGGPVIFHGTVTLSRLQSCTFSHVQFRDCPGIAIRWDGNSRRVTESYISFVNVLGSANDAADNNQYNGDTSSLKLWMCVLDSINIERSGLLMQASWGNAVSNICFIDSIIMSRVSVNQTASNGTEVRGTFFRLDAHDWRVMFAGINTVLGDVGMFLYTGDGYIHNIYRNGGRGYIVRVWNCGLKRTGETYYYNNVDLNSNTYGSIDTRTTVNEKTTWTSNGNSFVFNNTAGNKDDVIGYWSSLCVIGELQPGSYCQVRNNLGFKLTTRGKPPIAMDQSNRTWPVDSSYNLYYPEATGVVDPVTGTPVANSPVIGKGQAASWIRDDVYHHARTGAIDIGAVQHGGAPVTPPNVAPVANAGADKTITLPTNSVSLDGSASKDADGSIAKYSWAQVSGPSTANLGTGGVVTTAGSLVEGVYVFSLTVTDNAGATGTDQIKVTVLPASQTANPAPPKAVAGADQTITLPVNSARLDGSGSSSPSGSVTGYSWKEVSGPSSVTLGTTAVITAGNLQQGVYVFSLTVTDNHSKTATDNVTVTVKPAANTPPIADAGNDINITLPTNTATLDGTGSSDPGGSISLYAWTKISGPNDPVQSGAKTATLNLSALVAGDYVFELKVTDYGNLSATDRVNVHVGAKPNTAPVANAGPDQTITAPVSSVTLDGSGSTDPDGSISAYAWSFVSGPAGSEIGAGTTDQPKVTGLVPGTYVFNLTVTDNSGAKSSDKVTIIVNPPAVTPNQAPVANAGYNLTITLPTSSTPLNGTSSFDPDGTIVSYAWSQVSGPVKVTFSAAGTVTPTVSGLTAGTYVFKLTVKDNDGATASDQVTVVVNPSAVKANTNPIANAGKDGTITLPANTFVLDGSKSSDPDGSIVSYQWVQLSGPATAVTTFMSSATVTLNDLKAGVYTFQVTVTDNRGATAIDQMVLTVKNSSNTTTDELVIYPNPATTTTHAKVTSSITGMVKSTLFDMSGRIVWTDQSDKTGTVIERTFALDRLAPGVYSVQVNIANKKVLTSKFVKK